MSGPLLLCARHELTLAVRSRWTQIFAGVFGILSLAVSGSGYVLSGGSGVQDFARTSASLIELVLLLVPLTALLVGVTSLAGERGAAELLYSQPVGRHTILFGRLLGLFTALLAAQALGFGGAGLAIFSQSGGEGVGGFLLLMVGSAALTAVFLGIAGVLAAGGPGRRSRALALGLVVWFVTAVLFDVVALGAASLLPSGAASRVLIVAVVVNPTDAIRTATLLGTEGTAAFGAASLALLRFTHGSAGAFGLLGASVALWIVAAAAVAAWRLSRTDL